MPLWLLWALLETWGKGRALRVLKGQCLKAYGTYEGPRYNWFQFYRLPGGHSLNAVGYPSGSFDARIKFRRNDSIRTGEPVRVSPRMVLTFSSFGPC